ILGGLLLGMLFPKYLLLGLVGGVGGTGGMLFLALFYSTVKARGLQRIGLTVQYADGSDDYFDIIYDKMPVDVTASVKAKNKEGEHVYLIKDVEGSEWILHMDHPLDEVLPRFDSIPLFAGMPTPILTRFITGASLSDNKVKLDVKPSFLDRLLRRKQRDEADSKEVYAYATPVTVKRQKMANPAFDGERSLFKDVVSYDYIELQKEKEQLEDHNRELEKMLKNHLPITLRVKDLRVENEQIKANWKLLLLIGLACAAALIALYFLGVIGR
ncbi:MAG: hypothetical protein ABC596_08870, partial [Candidatus Methanosuratincola petrocarbonis]